MRDFNELDAELVSEMPALKPTSNTMSEGFADIIFSYRIRQGLTQQKLADLATVAVKTIHRIEGGSGGITDKTYEKVLKALDVDWEEAVTFLAERKKKVQQQLTMA
ncbi:MULTISPECIES: helix-turn-helix transcriptional regulator [Bacillati]